MAIARVALTFLLCLALSHPWLSPRLADSGVSVLYLPLATLAVALTARWTLAEAACHCAAFAAAQLVWSAVNGHSLAGTLPFLAVDVAEASCLAAILQWRRGAAYSLGRIEEIIRFVVAVPAVAIAFGGLGAALAAHTTLPVALASDDPLRTWRDWAAGDIAAYASLTAAALLLRHVGTRRAWRVIVRRWRELGALTAFLLLAVSYDFAAIPTIEDLLLGRSYAASEVHPAMMFLSFPAVIWLSASFGALGAAVAIVLTVAPGLHLAQIGYGPTWILDTADRVLMMQAWASVCALAALVVAALADLARRRERLRRRAASLARRRALERFDFIAAFNHELRTPLNGVTGFAHLLASELGGPLSARNQEFVAGLTAAAQRLAALIVRMLATRMVGADGAMIAPVLAPAHGLIEEARRACAPLARAAGATLEVNAPSSLDLRCDPQAAALALGDVIAHAVGAAPAGGVVRIAARRAGRDVAISVAFDAGARDAASLLDRRAMVRADDTGGVGLRLADLTMTRHGGELEVRSREGGGVEVRLRFPAGQGPPTPGCV